MLLRGIVFDTDEFDNLTRYFCYKFVDISSRYNTTVNIGDKTATLIKNVTYLPLHSESAYCPYPRTPDMGFFMCLKAQKDGSAETFLVDGVEMLKNIPSLLKERFKNEDIIYEYTWEPERWKAQFGVNTIKELTTLLDTFKSIEYCMENNETLHVLYSASALQTLKDGKLAFSNGIMTHLPAINFPPFHDKKVFAKVTNQVYWSDMTPLSNEEINQLFLACANIKIHHQWQDNDILLFDNLSYMHGREMAKSETGRVILSRFGYMR